MLFVTFVLLGCAHAAYIAEPNLEARGGGGGGGSKNGAYCSSINKSVTRAYKQAAATAYCRSYLSLKPQATVMAVVTSTTTITCVAPTEAVAGAKARRNDTNKLEVRGKKPYPKPDCYNGYSKSAEISSACSCLSIPAGTTTTTSTETAKAATTPASFQLVASSDDLDVNGKFYLLRDYPGGFNQDTGATANVFSLDTTNNHLSTETSGGSQVFGFQSVGQSSYVFFYDAGTIANNGYTYLTCGLSANDDDSCNLDCTSGGGRNVNSVDPNGLDAIQNEWVLDTQNNGVTITPQIVPL